jgi:hypothetical protein
MRSHKPRRRPAYYTVWALRDGTVVAAGETGRKPLPSQRRRWGKIDEDGVWQEFNQVATHMAELQERHWIAMQVSITSRLNSRRAIRELVLPRLGGLEERLDAIARTLGIEQS